MILYIDTNSKIEIILRLKKGKSIVAESVIRAERSQAEKLLPGIIGLLKENKSVLADLAGIEVNDGSVINNDQTGSFTSLRIGVVTANALAYGLGIPVRNSAGKCKKSGKISLVEPRYSAGPSISVKKPVKSHDGA